MQLFNGLNMGMIKFYRLDFETPETGNGKPEEVDYSEKLNTINQKINELKNEDQNTENDAAANAANAAKETLNSLIDTEFLSWFINSLNEDQKNSLKGTLKQLLDAHKNEENFKKEYMWLIDLATALGVEWYKSTEESDRKHWINWDINDESIQLLEDWKTTTWKFYENGKRVETAPEWVNTVWTTIGNQLKNLKPLLEENGKYKDNEWLKKASRLLENIQKIIENPIESNVQLLQQYIFDNLDDDMKDENDEKLKKTFMDKNKYNKSTEKFDWKFWETTLAGLNKVLEKTWKYIDNFKDQPSEWAEDEPFKNVKVKKSINLPEWDDQINAKDLLESLPDGAKAEFKDNAWINKSKTDEQEVTVVVRSWDKTKEITIIATVDTTSKKVGLKIKEAWNPTTPTTPETTSTTKTPITPTKPLEITINGQAEEHPVVTSDVTKKINTPLYYVNTWNEATSEQNNKVDENGDREYLMQVNNETYKVKLDQNWNLKPLAINYESGAKLLLKNNPSCIAYLQSKIPANLPGNPRIARNPNMEDYVIRSTTDRWVKWLTIEPMTLDGKWVAWSNLWNNLALLNFTNFLRWNKNIDHLKFKNDNPDLKLDNGKLYVRIKKWTRLADNSKSGKWYEVNLSKFWIPQNALEDFIKYNNGEDWDDNWDKKKDNKGYTKIDFPNISGPAAPAATETTAAQPAPAAQPTAPTAQPAPAATETTAAQPAAPAAQPAAPTAQPAPAAQPAAPAAQPAAPAAQPAAPTAQPAPAATETTDAQPAPATPETPTESDKKEIPNELWKMDDNDFNAMKNSLSDNMFIEKSEDNKITYNLQKVKNYLDWLKNDEWSTFRDKLWWKPEWRAWISAIQILLNEKYSNDNDKLEIDWKLWPKTKEKVTKFQEGKNIPDDGLPWWDTIKNLLGDFREETPARTPADSPADSPAETTPNPEQTTQKPQNLWDTSWMEHAQQTGYLPTGPDNAARTPTENSDI